MISPASPDNESIRKTADVLERLHNATKDFNTETSHQTCQMIKLTKAILLLTGILVLGLFVQIGLALWK